MSDAVATQNTSNSLTGLLIPLTDRTLVLPNVAVAELIPYRVQETTEGMPSWFLGQIAWRDLRLPLLSFENAAGGQSLISPASRVVVINALGGRPTVKFIALLVQGIPRSVKLSADLPRTDMPLHALELAAVRVGDTVARIPDLLGLEQKLADAGLI